MYFSEFCSHVQSALTKYLGKGFKTELREVCKNNGITLTGLIITGEGEQISPTVYLDSFYREYCSGEEMGDIIYRIGEIYRQNRVDMKVDLDFFADYERARERLFVKVINYDRNKERLRELPHRRFLDLAVVCFCSYLNDFLGRGSIQVDYTHMEKWGIDEETLLNQAIENTRKKLSCEIRTMDEVLIEILTDKMVAADRIDNPESIAGAGPEEILHDASDSEKLREILGDRAEHSPMYVCSLNGRFFGAAAFLYEEDLAKFGALCQRNFYIIPSSVHELIFIPDSGYERAGDLKDMIAEVNETQVLPEERLSDNLYYYSRREGRVSVWNPGM